MVIAEPQVPEALRDGLQSGRFRPAVEVGGDISSVDDLGQQANGRILFELSGVSLPPAVVDRLWDRTEGWPVGLYLATLAIAEEPDQPPEPERNAPRPLRDLTANDRGIVMHLFVL